MVPLQNIDTLDTVLTCLTARHFVGGELPSLQDIYTRRCTRKSQRIIKDSSHPSHRLLSLLPSGRRLRSIRSHTSRLGDSFFPQANEQSELIHPTAHSHFTICHALHFNTVQLDYTHTDTALTQQPICYHWIPSNAHTWHCVSSLCIICCTFAYYCVHTYGYKMQNVYIRCITCIDNCKYVLIVHCVYWVYVCVFCTLSSV